MSAFVMPKESIETITKMFYFYEQGGQAYFIPKALRDWIKSIKDVRDFSAMLYNENQMSVCARYNDTFEPVTKEFFDGKGKQVNRYQFLKLLKCWEYQSCESDEIVNGFLFKNIKKTIHMLMDEIINDLPEYKAATWSDV